MFLVCKFAILLQSHFQFEGKTPTELYLLTMKKQRCNQQPHIHKFRAISPCWLKPKMRSGLASQSKDATVCYGTVQ